MHTYLFIIAFFSDAYLFFAIPFVTVTMQIFLLYDL